jgi:very-short-patch-repair endonuclease
MTNLLDLQWTAFGIPIPVRELVFHPTRKWRFDYAWPDLKIAVEIEGGIWMNGRGAHSRPSNIERDMQKQNAGGLLGWRIFRFTPRQLKTGEVQEFMKTVFQRMGQRTGQEAR